MAATGRDPHHRPPPLLPPYGDDNSSGGGDDSKHATCTTYGATAPIPAAGTPASNDADEEEAASRPRRFSARPGSAMPATRFLDDGDDGASVLSIDSSRSRSASPEPPPPPTGWLQLPHKTQLFVLALCRLSEPLTQTSLLSYLYCLLESFHGPDEDPPSPSTISRYAGIMASSFALSQCLTGMFWGRLSDRIGRKPCILAGLFGTTLSILGFGFSGSFGMALACRIMGGCLNGNVGVLRTVVSEVVREKRHQSRAFLIMPMCFNIGIIVGPALGGLLADPAGTWPGAFGNVAWMKRWPYALPNIVSAVFLSMSWLAGFFFLQETHPKYVHRRDPGREAISGLTRFFRRLYGRYKGYTLLPHDATSSPSSPTTPLYRTTSTASSVEPKPLKKILTRNILCTLLAFTILPLHNATFMSLYGVFFSTPRSTTPRHGLHFSGGLGLPAQQVGAAMSLLGSIGIAFQLLLYPPLQARLGLLRSFRLSCWLFPLAYLLAPLLTLLPSTAPPPEPASGPVVWAGLALVLGLQVTARTFALPGSVILLTNSVEHQTALGTVHGIGSSLASAARAVGPVTGAWAYAVGLEHGVVGAVYWGMAGVACVGAAWGAVLREGKGCGR